MLTSIKAEFLPPVDGDIAKVTWVEPFTNFQDGFAYSRVEDLSDSKLAKARMWKMIAWVHKFLPRLKGAKVISVTSFW
jgi:hypothetical protein